MTTPSPANVDTHDFLPFILSRVRQTLRSRYYDTAPYVPRYPASLRDTLQKKFSLICEIKHATPSGTYRDTTRDVRNVVETYRTHGADAISVVVEPTVFHGTLTDMVYAAESGLPILFKDFIISEAQLDAAARTGAHAVLLIMSVLDACALSPDTFIDLAHQRGLEVVLECSTKEELLRALDTHADIVGINNRNLRTLHVDIHTTPSLLRAVGPLKKPVIAESGVRTPDDVLFLKEAGVSGVLIGTVLWTVPDMGKLLGSFKRVSGG